MENNQCNQPSNEVCLICSIQDYINKVLSIKKEDDEVFIFRGETSIDFVLKPSVGRIENYSKEIERQLFIKFKKNFYFFSDCRPKNDMEVLFLAQHYGLKTRLLDWSYNPLVALYFACEKTTTQEKKNGRVYYKKIKNLLKDSNCTNKMPTTMEEILNIKKDYYVVPDYTDNRYKNQQALFMLSCQPDTDINNSAIEYFEIKYDSKNSIIKDLAFLGFNKAFIYPTLESLCDSINTIFTPTNK